MKDIVQGLGLTEIFARLCPGLILLSSAVLWFSPSQKQLGQLKQYEWVLLALGLIAAYTLGLILEAASGWLAHRYTKFGGSGYRPLGLTQRSLYRLRFWFFSLLVGFRFRMEVSTAEGLLRIVEQLEENEIEAGLGDRFSPLDLIWSYRAVVSGPLGERAQPLLRVSENIRARLLFTLGVEFALLVTAAVALLRIIVESLPWTVGLYKMLSSLGGPQVSSTSSWPHCEPCWLVLSAGVLFSALLRPVMTRLWHQELFFTFSLSRYVDDARGLLTRRQGTDVVPSNVRAF